ncbi:unnamed protein product [Penicillium salamii]|uniref:Uncharacterized protein n=1 Tax=Penicillium salamii TaxID=1612424 RepID=A0A9W4IL38_9EURO|nr:unnamed protein product [Penicillium salamii]CAG8133798.1 unnamed protein product [Penicillium salamii]CAG8326259.1 unnamed protein product [Penicillium salamii]CAG8408815.1 unnamed protein product [Penicillium salamii]CAG8411846.1 unnamed protein product [Penicillium salamii]
MTPARPKIPGGLQEAPMSPATPMDDHQASDRVQIHETAGITSAQSKTTEGSPTGSYSLATSVSDNRPRGPVLSIEKANTRPYPAQPTTPHRTQTEPTFLASSITYNRNPGPPREVEMKPSTPSTLRTAEMPHATPSPVSGSSQAIGSPFARESSGSSTPMLSPEIPNFSRPFRTSTSRPSPALGSPFAHDPLGAPFPSTLGPQVSRTSTPPLRGANDLRNAFSPGPTGNLPSLSTLKTSDEREFSVPGDGSPVSRKSRASGFRQNLSRILSRD